MYIEMELVPGNPGDVQLIDVTNVLGQASWFYEPEADREATKELAAELRQMGAIPPKLAITCKVHRLDGERLVPKRCGFQIAIKLAHRQGRTVGFLEERIIQVDGEYPSKFLVGEVRRGSTNYEVFVTSSGRGWEAFEAEIDGPVGTTTGRSLGRAARLPAATGLAREHVMAHGARERRRILPRANRKAASHV